MTTKEDLLSEIDTINRVVEALCQESNCQFTDNDANFKFRDGSCDDSLLDDDKVHMSRIWGYEPDIYINKIQVLQNRAARIICDNFDWNVSASALVKSLGWFSVNERRDYFMGVLMYRCLTNNAPAYLCDHFNVVSDVLYGTRSNVNGNLYVPNVKRDTLKQSLLYMGPVIMVIWNNLPSFLKSASSLDGLRTQETFKKLTTFFIECICFFPVHYFLLGAGEEYNFCNQPTQDKYIDK